MTAQPVRDNAPGSSIVEEHFERGDRVVIRDMPWMHTLEPIGSADFSFTTLIGLHATVSRTMDEGTYLALDLDPGHQYGVDTVHLEADNVDREQPGVMALVPNHIHANKMDVLAALELATLRFSHFDPMHDAQDAPWHPDEVFAAQVTALYHRTLANDLLLLPDCDIEVLGPCLTEAIWTAKADRCPSVADAVNKLHREITAGRKSTVLVFNQCEACWPIQ